MNDVIDFIHASRERYVEELKQFLAIPSISAMPEHKGDVRRCAEWAAAEMARIGLENVRVIDTAGHPLVYADWLHAEGAPTVLFYGHYDVQPVDPLDLWQSPPFEATIRDGDIYARGACDDKGQVFVHFKAIEAHMKKAGRLPINMKVILEGEEEVGSEHLAPYVREHAAELAADMVLISDTEMFDRGVPSLCYGLRGLAYMQIDLRGTKGDLHSGQYGGAVANPANVLAPHHRAAQGQERHHQDPGFLRRCAGVAGGGACGVQAAAVRREGGEEAPRRAAVRRRAGLLAARADVGAPHAGRQRPAVGMDGRRRQDRHSGRRDGEGEHAARAQPAPREDRRAVRGVREEDRAEDGGGEGDAACTARCRG